jgi:hypothetical protein
MFGMGANTCVCVCIYIYIYIYNVSTSAARAVAIVLHSVVLTRASLPQAKHDSIWLKKNICRRSTALPRQHIILRQTNNKF